MKIKRECDKCKKKFVYTKIKKIPHEDKFYCTICYKFNSKKEIKKTDEINNEFTNEYVELRRNSIRNPNSLNFNISREELEFLKQNHKI